MELARLRTEAGFKSAREFYVKSGGKKVLQFSYVNYWKMENGKLLPKPKRLSLLAACLKCLPGPRGLGRLVEAYLREYVGSDPAFEWIMEVLAKNFQAPRAPRQEAAHRLMREKALHLGVEQTREICGNFANYWAWIVLSSSSSPWPLPKLARQLRLGLREIQKACGALARIGVAERAKDGTWRCALGDRFFALAPFQLVGEAYREKMEQYQKRMAEAQGKMVSHHCSVFRADEMDFQHFYPQTRELVHQALAYDSTAPSDTAALFLVEGNICR